MGADFYRTPRDIVRSFVGLLSVLEQNPDRDWQSFVGDGFISKSAAPASTEEEIAKGVPPPADHDDLEILKL